MLDSDMEGQFRQSCRPLVRSPHRRIFETLRWRQHPFCLPVKELRGTSQKIAINAITVAAEINSDTSHSSDCDLDQRDDRRRGLAFLYQTDVFPIQWDRVPDVSDNMSARREQLRITR